MSTLQQTNQCVSLATHSNEDLQPSAVVQGAQFITSAMNDHSVAVKSSVRDPHNEMIVSCRQIFN